jgi:23S rRNA pseudouridine955/2504/2580 synthase/23S rRNA pseudouridine1911/1915/1917 synthase
MNGVASIFILPSTTMKITADGHKQLTLQLTETHQGKTILDVLVATFPSYPEQSFVDACAAGYVKIDGAVAESASKLVAGSVLEYLVPMQEEPEVDTHIEIMYEDEHLAVINKPSNLPCHPSGSYFKNTLIELLKDKYGFSEAFMVNRLDRETSGIVIVAKSQEGASLLGKALMEHGFEKHYLVKVVGEWKHASTYVARGYIWLERGTVVRKKRVFSETEQRGQECVTELRLISTDGKHSLVEATPITGRPHQIRATMKALGYPVVGDKLYGVDETIYARMAAHEMTDEDWVRLEAPNQALHSWRTSFINPYTGKLMEFEAKCRFC